MYIHYNNIQVSLRRPDNETSRKTCKNAEEVKDFINEFLFNNIPICSINTTYSIMSRPHTIPKLPYMNYINITKTIEHKL